MGFCLSDTQSRGEERGKNSSLDTSPDLAWLSGLQVTFRSGKFKVFMVVSYLLRIQEQLDVTEFSLPCTG